MTYNLYFVGYVLRNNVPIGTMDIISGSIKFDSEAKIKRSASLVCGNMKINQEKRTTSSDMIHPSESTYPSTNTYTSSGKKYMPEFTFNRTSDMIKIVMVKNRVEYPLGTFMICSSPSTITSSSIQFSIELYDRTFIFDQSQIDSRLYIPSGSLYIKSIEDMIADSGILMIYKTPSLLATNIDKEYPVGTNKLEILNGLLSEIGYEDLWFDENGYAILSPKKDSTFVPKFTYRTNELSNVIGSFEDRYDTYDIPNVFVGVVSNPDLDSVLTYKAENNSASSEMSIRNRGYKLTKIYELDDIASQDELEKYIDNELLSSMQVLETVTFTTTIEGNHGIKDDVQIDNDTIQGMFIEKSWEIALGTNGTMTHTCERKVFL